MGRPKGSTSTPPDLYAGIWVAVLIQRIRDRGSLGKTLSIRQACRGIVARGGINSVIGGDLQALEEANAQRKKRWQRLEYDPDGSSVRPAAAGSLFASHTILNAGTLQARYSEANRLARSDPRVRLFWKNLARQILGLPIKKTC